MKKNSVEIKQAIAEKRNRCKEIINLCKTEVREMTEDEEKEVDTLKEEIEEKKKELEELEEELKSYDDKVPVEDEEKEKEEKKISRYNKKTMKNISLTELIRSKVNGQPMNDELRSITESTAKEMRADGLEVNGTAIPFELREATNLQGPISGNELNATISDTQGKSTIHTDYQSILEPVFGADVLKEFDTLVGLKGNVEIPRYGGVGSTWKGELVKGDETTMKFDGITASPKRLTTFIVLSKQLLMQSDYNVEAFVRKELINSITRKLQQTILGNTQGSTTQPQGLFYGATSVSAFDYAKLVEIEKAAEENNVTNGLGYVITPAIKASLRTTLKSNVAGSEYLFENSEVLGQHTVVTNDAKGLLYGSLKQIVICSWGNGIDMVVDPYTLADYDAIKITVNSYWDVVNRAPLTGEGVSGAHAVTNIFAYTVSGAVSGSVSGASGAVSGSNG